MTGVIFTIICLLIVLFLYDLYLIKRGSDLYLKINNDNDKNTACEYLKHITYKYKKTPLDNYRIGGVYDFILHDTNTAQNYYLEAVNQIKKNSNTTNDVIEINDNIFIRDRLEDRIRINFDAEHDDNIFRLRHLMDLNNELKNLEIKIDKKIESNTPIEDHITWKSDSQNVHDSNINNELRESYEKIKKYNKNNNIFLWDINDIIGYIKNINPTEMETHNIPDAINMLEYIQINNAHISKINVSEKKFISEIFSKIICEKEEKKRINMLENLMMNLKESYGNGTPVCVTGRTTRILSSFAGNDDSIGIFKSKPVIKNEIFLKAGNIRNRLFNNVSKEVQEQYNNNIKNIDTQNLEYNMKSEIRNMINSDYSKLIIEDKKFIDNIIEEIDSTL
jgi:hypothetical protein